MYALHPGSLPPHGVREKQRLTVTALDLARLYKLKLHEYIVWDKADGYDWFDFIHLYPSYYGRYALLHDGTPHKDVPCVMQKLGGRKAGGSSNSGAAISTRGKTSARC